MSQQFGSLISITLCALPLVTVACSTEGRSEQREVAPQGVIAARATVMPDEERWHDDPVMAGHKVDGIAVLAAVRTARHPEFERIVFEFRGDGLPNYKVGYIDEPVTRCGSGETLSLDGDSWLEIHVEPATVYDENGQSALSRRDFSATTNLKQLELICDFESALTWVAWLSARDRFRVLELKSPPRLVVDVR
jgi:hypothetical protein